MSRFLRGDSLPIRAQDEEALFDEVARDPEGRDGPATREALAELARAKGDAFAAAWFYLKTLRERPPARAPRERIERIFIIPGAFYTTFPEYNTDGLLVYELAKRFGLPVERVELPEFAPVEVCAELLRERIEELPEKGTLALSVSKGTSDLLTALHQTPRLGNRFAAWISVGGLPRGTYSADELLSRGWFAKRLLALSAWMHGGTLETLRSLRASPGGALCRLPQVPPVECPVISIIPVPLHAHVTAFLRRRYVSLQKFGPNDGMCLLADSIIPGSRAIPVWGADHFFQIPGFSRFLLEAMRELVEPSERISPPLSRSPGVSRAALSPGPGLD